MNIVSRAQAIAEDRRFYFTGVPCVHGHLAERYVKGKHCRECARIAAKKHYDEKLATGYTRARPRIGEVRPRSANAEAQARYREQHANDPVYLEKRRQYARDWRQKNLERSNEISRQTRERKKEREKE